MKICSWNVNGIRAILKKGALLDFIEKYSPDILCLQEIKGKKEQIDVDFENYEEVWNPAMKAGYAGTAIFIRKGIKFSQIQVPNLDCADKFGDTMKEGRVLVLEFDGFFLINVYVPNSKPDLSRLMLRKEKWDPWFLDYMKELEKKKPVVFCGDFNAAHEEIDIARPKTNHYSAGFTDEERMGITNLINAGFIDTFRFLHPDEVRYTWWSHWGKARENNVGWRIDYFFISSEFSSALLSAEIFDNIIGSDHCPVSICLDV